MTTITISWNVLRLGCPESVVHGLGIEWRS